MSCLFDCHSVALDHRLAKELESRNCDCLHSFDELCLGTNCHDLMIDWRVELGFDPFAAHFTPALYLANDHCLEQIPILNWLLFSVGKSCYYSASSSTLTARSRHLRYSVDAFQSSFSLLDLDRSADYELLHGSSKLI